MAGIKQKEISRRHFNVSEGKRFRMDRMIDTPELCPVPGPLSAELNINFNYKAMNDLILTPNAYCMSEEKS